MIIVKKNGQLEKARQLEIKYQKMPSKDVRDPGYRRLNYVRYADDLSAGFYWLISRGKSNQGKTKDIFSGKSSVGTVSRKDPNY